MRLIAKKNVCVFFKSVMDKQCEMGSGSQNSRNDGFSKTLEKKIQRKQKRLQHMITNETGIECYDIPKKVQISTIMLQNDSKANR